MKFIDTEHNNVDVILIVRMYLFVTFFHLAIATAILEMITGNITQNRDI